MLFITAIGREEGEGKGIGEGKGRAGGAFWQIYDYTPCCSRCGVS